MRKLGAVLLTTILITTKLAQITNKNFIEITPLQRCLEKIDADYFKFPNTIIIAKKGFNLDLKFTRGVWQIDIVNLNILNEIKQKTNHFIISYNKIEELDKILEYLKSVYCFKARAKYLIIANKRCEVGAIARILWQYRLYKSAIILENGAYDIKIFQINFKQSLCGQKIKEMKLGHFQNGTFHLKSELFNPQMKNGFRNCPIRIIFSSFTPWINEDYTGIFIDIMNLVAEINQFQLIYLPENPIYAAEQIQSYTYQSILDDFNRGYADIYLGVGNHLQKTIFEITNTVYDENLYWVVPKAHKMPYGKAMIQYYPLYFWLAIILYFLFSWLIFTLITHKQNNEFQDVMGNALYIFAISLNLTSGKLPKKTAQRILVIIYSWISLLICVILQGRLYDILSNPLYENDITNLDKLLDSGLPLRFPDGIAIIFLFTGPQNQKVFDTYIPKNASLSECLNDLIISKDYATIIDKGILITHPNILEIMNVFYLTYFQNVFYMKKHHELFKVVELTIKRIVESGFVEKFVAETRWKYFITNKSYMDEEKIFKLSVKHLQGAIWILICGLGVANLIFLLEIVYHTARNKLIK